MTTSTMWLRSLRATVLAAATASAPLAAQAVPADSGERARAVHLLNRIAYGPRPGDVERVLAVGIDRYIAQQLAPETLGDAVADRYLTQLDVLQMSTAVLRREFVEAQRARQARQRRGDTATTQERMAQPTGLRRHLVEFQQAAVARAILSERQLSEVMVDFWTNHFNVFLGKGPVRYVAPEYVQNVIRRHALGSFEELLIATAQSPAMLFYLDNAQSIAEGAEPPQLGRLRRAAGRRPGRANPRMARQQMRAESTLARLESRMPRGLNENYARELLELHTLGVDGGYTQEDIVNVARILTGWGVDQRGDDVRFVFNGWAHDSGEKVVIGHRFPRGGGIDEGIELLRLLAHHPSTMRHVSTKLCERFVSDAPPDGCVDAGVHAWEQSAGSITAVVRAIVTSPDFWAPEHRGAKTKTPLEFVASAVRAVGGAPDATPTLGQLVGRLGQPLYLEAAPTGYPERQESWVNAGALLQRFNIALAIAGGRAPGVTHPATAAVTATEDQEVLIATVNAVILAGAGSAHTLDVMRRQVADVRDPVSARDLAVGLALGSPEFQRQ